MSAAERQVKSKRLQSLTLPCPQCGTTMQATGKMNYNPVIEEWVIEYWCPSDQQLFTIYTPETAGLTRDIAKEAEDH